MVDKKELTIWTVGHSTRSLSEFLELLVASEIQALADVRRYPRSRKYPQFNEIELSNFLAKNKIEYSSLRQLGGRRRARKDSMNTVWRSESFRGYADYMETVKFKEGIERLLELAGRKRTAVMCSEALWWRCHRSLISDYLKAAGGVVEHLIDLRKTEAHPFTSVAQVKGGKLFYGAA
jgi:uncharacterized protein (DUF488 family)